MKYGTDIPRLAKNPDSLCCSRAGIGNLSKRLPKPLAKSGNLLEHVPSLDMTNVTWFQRHLSTFRVLFKSNMLGGAEPRCHRVSPEGRHWRYTAYSFEWVLTHLKVRLLDPDAVEQRTTQKDDELLWAYAISIQALHI